MNTITATEAQTEFSRLMDEVTEKHKTIKITGEKSNAVLVSEADWNSIQETLHLISIPGLRESIIEGLNAPLEDCAAELEW
ncbi:MAG: type II toxin-antitoxin system Phd/YefM family antitoxin [Pyrinomonadaceae bacterium]